MSNYTNIKIPVGLAIKVLNSKTNRKALDTYFMLKSINNTGWFLKNVKALTKLEKDLKICYKTIKKRLDILSKMGLIEVHQKHIKLASYKQIQKKYNLFNGYYLIKANLLEKVKIEDYLIAIAIKEKKDECSKAFYYKHLRLGLDNDIIKGVFKGEKPKSSYKKAVTKAHLNDYVTNANNSNLSYAFNCTRADIEVGYKKLSNMLGYSGRGSLAYTKRKLQANGIIEVNKRVVAVSTKTHSTKKNRTTVLGTLNYDVRTKKLNLQMPDEIIIKSQNEIINHKNA